MVDISAPRTARARARAELTREIKDAARRQLGEVGPAALSLRAVARELGMVSSAVYRYFPSRDELLTALIVDAYASVGDAAAAAESAVERSDLTGRWLAIAVAFRQWARGRPQEYALIFGSPVPGYQAPADTIDPAGRIPVLLLAIVDESSRRHGRVQKGEDQPRIPKSLRADLLALGGQLAPEASDVLLARAVMAWSELVGLVSFELFGHLHNAIHDYETHFEYQMRVIAAGLGL